MTNLCIDFEKIEAGKSIQVSNMRAGTQPLEPLPVPTRVYIGKKLKSGAGAGS